MSTSSEKSSNESVAGGHINGEHINGGHGAGEHGTTGHAAREHVTSPGAPVEPPIDAPHGAGPVPTAPAEEHAAPHHVSGRAFGIDIGGSGIKGAPVDLATGEFLADRVRIPTPQPATPKAVAEAVATLVDSFHLPHDLPIGVTFPAVIQHGVARSAANVDDSWIGTDVTQVVAQATGRRALAVNDADAAGFAETVYGAARDVPGVVLVVTLGTGIGSCLVVDGTLVPNTELGHLEIDGHDAESRAADSAREREDLTWEEWAERLQRYFRVVEDLFWPDLIVVGGGVSKKHEKFLPLLDLRTPIVPAALRNAAGIVGAAALAARGTVLD